MGPLWTGDCGTSYFSPIQWIFTSDLELEDETWPRDGFPEEGFFVVKAARCSGEDAIGDTPEVISWLSCVLYWLCDLGQVIKLLCASVSSSIK